MRYRSTLLLRKSGLSALIALLFALAAGAAQAQVPVFDDVDWLLDRGNLTFNAATSSGIPTRPGSNNINNVANNPGHGVQRWVFPRTLDISTTGVTTLPTIIVDNANATDPQNFKDTQNNIVRVMPGYAMQTGNDPQVIAHSYLNGGWNLPAVAPGPPVPVNDYRSTTGGFSFSTDPNQTYTKDYAYVLATHNDFLVIDAVTGQQRAATRTELAALPNAATNVYAAVQNVLINDIHPTSVVSSGATNLVVGNYGVDVYMPGDFTKISKGGVTTGHASVLRAFVRVSWFRTIDANGNPVKANIDNPTTSRIYEIDPGAPGWQHIQGGGSSPAVFPFSGDPRDQITVTLYTLTPDDINDPGFGGSLPVITADAVRFVAKSSGANAALGNISPNGRVLGPVVGTNKLLNDLQGNPITDAQPLFFFAREESVPDPTPRIPTDPTLPASATNPLIPDPTATITAPVFYCVNNQNLNTLGGDPDGLARSIDRVRWRYVGIADASSTDATSAASPLLANVRCRDGVTRTMVYFITTNSTATLGHIYAFDAAGNLPLHTTQNYWTYPSYVPLTAAELAANKVPAQAHDPNYKRPASFTTLFPPTWGVDAADPFFHWDGEIVANPAQAGDFIVRKDTSLPAFGGSLGSPIIIDDPDNLTGAQILIVGNQNGRVYAFDAGGRGDYDPTVFTTLGTTQRIWTYPHFGADAYYAKFPNGTATNLIKDDPSLGTILASPTYDPTYPAPGGDPKKVPFFIGAGDGHMYALNAANDVLLSYNANTLKPVWQERRNWVYPAPPETGNTGLGGAISTAAIFQPAGAGFPYLYFTCEGRVYAVQEVPAVVSPTAPTTNTLKWVFPNTPTPPNADPANDATVALDPGFNGTAPVLMSQATLNAAPVIPSSPAVTNDFCYVLEGNSILIGLNAFNGKLIASGITLSGANTSASPIATLLTGLPGESVDTINPQPALVFADDDGAIWGLTARPDTTQPGTFGTDTLLSEIWHHHEVNANRIASASLASGMIVEGDEGGQLRAYGVGVGLNGLGNTLGPNNGGEPAEIALGAGNLSIDLRVFDIYRQDSYNKIVAGTNTPNRKNAGGGYTKSVLPDPGNLIAGNTEYGSDWGDMLYVSAAGVYHAQPTDDKTKPLHGTGPPRIHVTFTISQPGGASTSYAADIFPQTKALHAAAGELWPDDVAINNGEHDTLQIFGIDPNMGNPAAQLLQGRDKNVYPWVFSHAFPIYPGAPTDNGTIANFLPGVRGYRITAHAEIYQDLEGYDPATMTTTPFPNQSAGTPTYAIGQHDYTGLIAAFQTPPSQTNILGIARAYSITNPIAVTTRSISPLNPDLTIPLNSDMTGKGNLNVVGLYGSVQNALTIKPANVGELLGNGNRQVIPGVVTTNSAVKSLFAPLPMVPDGSTSTYGGVDNAGNRQDAFYIVDRSNMWGLRRKPLQIQVLTRKLGWHGWSPSQNPTATGSAVMNPLPWEQLPTDAQDTLDYPSIPTSAFTVRKTQGDEDAIGGSVQLKLPNYQFNGSDAIAGTRQLVATPFTMAVNVPRFQPANINYGLRTFNGVTFGSSFLDMSGVNRGNPSDPTVTQNYDKTVLGPLQTSNGQPTPLGNALSYPAAGYVSAVVIRVIPPDLPRPAGGYNPTNFFQAARYGSNAGVNEAYRALEVGVSVPPGVKMRVAETTLDVGKLPHGTGYTPLTNNSQPRSFQVPFAPDMSPGLPGPFIWDDPTLQGEFFRPFTVYNESNVNLVDVRVAKLLGQNRAQITGRALSPFTDPTVGVENGSFATTVKMYSDQVNNQSIAPLFALPFKNVSGQPGVGNIGVISSYDHISSSSNPTTSLFSERALWPLNNPFVVQADIDNANQFGALLPTVDDLANGIFGWKDQIQPQPTIGKPHVGDTQGRSSTIPDKPYSATVVPGTLFAADFQRPRIGVAIPLGTPVGTYSAPIYTYEDNTPLQWQEWLSNYPTVAGTTSNFPASHDGVLNITQAGTPSEAHTDPTFILKATVREAKLSRGVTSGDLPMLDVPGSWADPLHPELPTPPGSDTFPAVFMAPGTGGNVFNRNLFMYWSTNRRQGVDGYIDPTTGLLKAYAPYQLAYSNVSAPYSAVGGTGIVIGDFDFANGQPLPKISSWWSVPVVQLYTNANITSLFPSTSGASPFLAGPANVDTMRLSHPAVASSVDFSGGYGSPNPNDNEAYLFWQGQVDKLVASAGGQQQARDSRVSWTSLNGGAAPGVPTGNINAMPNDPGLTKLAPRPLLVKLPAANGAPAQKFLYVFWHAGNQSNASIYYNALGSTALNTPFDGTSKWLLDAAGNPLGDLKLPMPGALVWQSDPAPVYRHIPDPYGSNQVLDVIDVVYTGVLKGRQTVETLLCRYKINRVAPAKAGDPPVGTLTILPIKPVVGEVLTRLGSSNTYQGRDAAWELGTGPEGLLQDPTTDPGSQIKIFLIQGGLANNPVLINAQPGMPNLPQRGRYDQASGLIYFDSALGGQITVDSRSGTIRFPQVAPALADRIQVSYIPFIMRLNTSRDDSNIDRTSLANFGNLPNAPSLRPTAAITSSGNNTSPVVLFDRGLNPRAQLVSPQVVFGGTPTLDRMWVFYRKNDPSGVAKSTIYYKAMRLMVKLPFPVKLGAVQGNGTQQMTPVTVGGNVGPYEIDWVRGRIYFTEADENSSITVSYTYYDPTSGNTGNSGSLKYQVAWGDEISTSAQQGDQTTPEVALPTDSAVSEGQVSAFKDPFLDKVWIFWSSTRAGSTDLYFETIAPQLYPTASNQR